MKDKPFLLQTLTMAAGTGAEIYQNSTFRRVGTPKEDDTIPVYANGSAFDYGSASPTLMTSSDSESGSGEGTEEEENQFKHVHQAPGGRLEESDTITILGSLYDQGIFQGMPQGAKDPNDKNTFLPSSVRMTSVLERLSQELDALSVIATTDLEAAAKTLPPDKEEPSAEKDKCNTSYPFLYFKVFIFM